MRSGFPTQSGALDLVKPSHLWCEATAQSPAASLSPRSPAKTGELGVGAGVLEYSVHGSNKLIFSSGYLQLSFSKKVFQTGDSPQTYIIYRQLILIVVHVEKNPENVEESREVLQK